MEDVRKTIGFFDEHTYLIGYDNNFSIDLADVIRQMKKIIEKSRFIYLPSTRSRI